MAASKNSKSTIKKTQDKKTAAPAAVEVKPTEKKCGTVYLIRHGRAYVNFGNNEFVSYPVGDYKIGDIVER